MPTTPTLMDLRLVEYEQTATLIGPETVYQPLVFNGVAPLLVEQPQTFCVLHQSGRAIAWFARFIAPAPIVDSPVFLQKPKIEFRRVKGRRFAWETTWDYVMAVNDSLYGTLDFAAAEKWPTTPVFGDVVTP